ncbi:type IV pilus modification protein PilV [Reinekea blandensis]|nr:type IV pilus modification protein PilV [Reinekea blandensis]
MKFQQGAGLIEVLVAMLVLAIGLLGFSAIQTQAMRMNFETMQRARAAALAEDLFDRMRANSQQAISTDNYLRDFDEDLPELIKDCAAEACTPVQMASWDLRRWMENLQTVAPGADARVSKALSDGTIEPNYVRLTIRLVETSELLLEEPSTLNIEQDELVAFEFYALL